MALARVGISKVFAANLVGLAGGLLCSVGSVQAGSLSYSAAAAFQNSYNNATPGTPPVPPQVSGQFEFGYYSDPTQTLTAFDETASIGGLEFLQSTVVQDSLVPAVFYNPASTPVTFSTLTLEPNQLAFHPGKDTDAVIRFIAPSAGSYNFSADFYGADSTSTLVEVFQSGTPGSVVGGGSVVGFQGNGLPNAFSYDQTLELAAGGYVDFLVNNDGDFSNDSTALKADLTVTPVPLPAAEGIGFSLLGGFGSLAALRKRFSRRVRIA